MVGSAGGANGAAFIHSERVLLPSSAPSTAATNCWGEVSPSDAVLGTNTGAARCSTPRPDGARASLSGVAYGTADALVRCQTLRIYEGAHFSVVALGVGGALGGTTVGSVPG
jgi:hypothetical protein